MKTLKEWTKTASREEIIHQLLELNDTFNSFDKYLRKELGEETYNDIVKNWCADRARPALKNMGMSDEDIDEFNESMGIRKNGIEA